MKMLTAVCSVLLAIGLTSCGGEKQEAQMEHQMMQESAPAKMDISVDMLATNTDPNCGMKLTTEAVKDTAVYRGKLYGFCSADCKENFKKDPQAKLSAMEEKMKEMQH